MSFFSKTREVSEIMRMLTNEKLWEEKRYLFGDRLLVHFILMTHFGGKVGLSKELGQK